MLVSIFIGLCAIGGGLPFVLRDRRMLRVGTYTWSTAVFGVGAFAGLSGLTEPSLLWNGFLYLDAFGGLLVMLISFMQWTAVLASVPHLEHEVEEGAITFKKARLYMALLSLFVLAMAVSALANNLGLLWIALEATTLATTFLVAFYAKPGSLEAAWKYLILCSTGIAFGLIGLLLSYYAAQGSGTEVTLNWRDLLALGSTLPPQLMQLAFIFVLIGYGTKAGLAPMHAWLPDAHSAAPAPISGLLSGILLPVALTAVLRFKLIVDASLGGSDWTGWLLIIFGVISVLIAAAFILVQHDYKRLLAYSSIEHMGIISILFGISGLAAVAGVIHLVGHALIKSGLFYGAASIVERFKTTKFENVAGIARALPHTALLFLIGMLALLAAPPSPLFLSEYVLVAQTVVMHPLVLAFALFALTVIAAGFIRQLIPFLYSRHAPHEHALAPRESWTVAHGGIALHYLLVAALGIALWTPQGFAAAQHIAQVLLK